MDMKAKFQEVASRWTSPPQLSNEQTLAEVKQALGDLEKALQALGRALLRDTQVRVSAVVARISRRSTAADAATPTEAGDPAAVAPEGENTSAEYLDCIGVHMA